MFVKLLLSFLALTSADFSENEVLAMFQVKPSCFTDSRASNFQIFDLEKEIGHSGKLIKVKVQKKGKVFKKTCVEIPKGYKSFIVEKDSCKVLVGVAPETVNIEEARYLLSKIHTFDADEDNDKYYFNKEVVPFRNDKSEWQELAKDRPAAHFLRHKDPDLKSRQTKYRSLYLELVEKTLKNFKLTKSDFEKVEFEYAGCH